MNRETEQVIALIRVERIRQDGKWGVQNHPDGKWSDILMEELGEAAKARLEKNEDENFCELVQSAAVLVAWLECKMRDAQDEPK